MRKKSESDSRTERIVSTRSLVAAARKPARYYPQCEVTFVRVRTSPLRVFNWTFAVHRHRCHRCSIHAAHAHVHGGHPAVRRSNRH